MTNLDVIERFFRSLTNDQGTGWKFGGDDPAGCCNYKKGEWYCLILSQVESGVVYLIRHNRNGDIVVSLFAGVAVKTKIYGICVSRCEIPAGLALSDVEMMNKIEKEIFAHRKLCTESLDNHLADAHAYLEQWRYIVLSDWKYKVNKNSEK